MFQKQKKVRKKTPVGNFPATITATSKISYIHSLLRLRLLWALPGSTSFFMRRCADKLSQSLDPWKAHRHAVQNWKPQSAVLHTPSRLTEWHRAGCWHLGHAFRDSSLKRVFATLVETQTIKVCFIKMNYLYIIKTGIGHTFEHYL